MFTNNTELLKTIKSTYKKLCKKLSKSESIVSLIWIPRKANKIAHKWTHNAFQKLKGYSYKKEITIINTNALFELLSNNQESYYLIIKYLHEVSDEQRIIKKHK